MSQSFGENINGLCGCRRYSELLDRHPLIVKSLTAGLLNALADFICQVFSKSAEEERVLFFFVRCSVDWT